MELIKTYSYNDITIIPAVISDVNHRKETNVFTDDNMLPIFTAPMSNIVSIDNFNTFENNHINAILPRNIDLQTRMSYLAKGKWVAFSLREFQTIFCYQEHIYPYENMKVCIDIANGHMRMLYASITTCKQRYKNIKIMVGNIANPETIKHADEYGVDYIRVGIGGGDGCTTTTFTGIHYGIASLIEKCAEIKKQNNLNIKIIADGSIKKYSDVAKALALGADYVMIGSMFASLIDSAAKIYHRKNILTQEEINTLQEQEDGNYHYFSTILNRNYTDLQTPKHIYKLFYGMASIQGQKDFNKSEIKSPEGTSKIIPITTTIEKWSKNMINYLQSTLSYTGWFDIKYLNRAQCCIISNNTQNSLNQK